MKPTKSEGIKRIIVWISNIHGELINSFEPCPWQLSSELIVTKQQISNSLAFCTRQPCCNQGIDWGNVRLDGKGAARDNNNNTFDGPTDIADHSGSRFYHLECLAITMHLCVGKLTYNNDGMSEVVGLDEIFVWVLLVYNFCTWVDSGFHSIQNCCSCSMWKKK